jgi:tetratricopeptide (TPR) repeat protein
MMPPQLTDSWSIAFLQILIVLLIFAFSIPSIIFQVTLPEEIQRLVNHYRKSHFLFPFITVVVVLLIFSLSFIWVLHPGASSLPSWASWAHCAASIIISLSLISLIIFWGNYLRKLSREKIVNYLENKLKRRFQKDGSILIKVMTDLITLGERSEAGYQKEIVLTAIYNIIEEIQDSEHYDGNSLEDILREFEKIAGSKDKPGNESDFQLSVDILEKILKRISIKKLSVYGDEMLAYHALKEIGKKLVELKLSKLLLKIVFIASSNSSVLFEIGLAAFKAGDYLSALAALNKLGTLALEASPIEPQAADDLLGLLAHFWTAGSSSQRLARSFFDDEDYRNRFLPLEQCLDQAIDSHYTVARYETSDKLITMKNEILREQAPGENDLIREPK